jgi:glycosyltransferase involved in cell wall biosynthesis
LNRLVSVIVPAYNVSLYIEDCIKSVINQTYSRWELIVVDDGSKDNTYDLAKKVADSDTRIQIVKQENQGVSVARNTGLKLAAGSDVIFLDGDDYWLPKCLQKLVAIKEQSGSQVGYCGYNHVYANGYQRNYRYAYPNGNILIPAIRGEVRFHIGAMLIDKNILIENNLNFTEGCLIGQDLEFMLKLAAIATFKSIPESLLMYRVRPNSAISSKWNWKKHFHAIKGVRRAAEFIIDHFQNSKDLSDIQMELSSRLGKMLNKFLWRILKTNSFDDAFNIIGTILEEPFYASVHEKFRKNNPHFMDWVKYSVVLSKNRYLWNMAKYL